MTLPVRLTRLLEPLRPGRDATVDLVASALLVALALAGLRTTFYGPGWLVPATLGVALGLWNAHLVTAYRWPAAVLAPLLAVTYYLLGGLCAVRDDLVIGVIPTGPTFAALTREPVAGWKELLTSVPPVDSAGPHLALPFLFGLVGAAVTYAMARRFSGASSGGFSAGVAALAPLVLLGVSFALGTMTPAAALAQGTGFGIVLLIWLAARAARTRPPLQNGAGRLARGVTAAVLLGISAAGAIVVGPELPGAQDTVRTVWRTSLVPPYDVSQFPSPLAGFRRFTKDNPSKLWETPLLKVVGLPQGTAIRFAVLDSYDGFVFGAGNQAGAGGDQPLGSVSPDDPADLGAGFHKVGSHIDVAAAGEPVSATVAIVSRDWPEVWVPTVGTVTGLSFEGPRARDLQDGLRLNAGTGTAVLPIRLGPGDGYAMTAIVDPAATGQIADPADGGKAPATAVLPPDVALATGSLVDPGQLGFLSARVDAWTGAIDDPWRKVLAVANQLRSGGTYTDGGTGKDFEAVYLPGHSLNRMGRFFNSTQLAGNDEQYAAALALAANRIGIPARVVVGAVPQPDGTVAGSDVHAWVEVKTAQGTWQGIPTAAFVPPRSRKPSPSQEQTPQRKTGVQVPPPAANNPPSLHEGPDQAQIASQLRQPPKNSLFDPSTWPAWLRWLLLIVGGPALALLLAWAVMQGSKTLRRYARARRGPPARRIARGWVEVIDQARDLGYDLAPTATRLEQAAAVAGAAPVVGARPLAPAGSPPDQSLRDLLVGLAAAANAHVFGAGDPSEEDAQRFWERVALARRALRARHSRFARLRAALSPRSLWPVAPPPSRTAPSRTSRSRTARSRTPRPRTASSQPASSPRLVP